MNNDYCYHKPLHLSFVFILADVLEEKKGRYLLYSYYYLMFILLVFVRITSCCITVIILMKICNSH